MPLTEDQLMPCPFCGRSKLKIIDIFSEDEPTHSYAKAVFCTSCHTTGRHHNPIGWAESKQEAMEAWNTRPLIVGQFVKKDLELIYLAVEEMKIKIVKHAKLEKRLNTEGVFTTMSEQISSLEVKLNSILGGRPEIKKAS